MLKLDKIIKVINNELAKGAELDPQKAIKMIEVINMALVLNKQLKLTPKEWIESAYKLNKMNGKK